MLLPHDYDNSSESYPVMYLQDAQNLLTKKQNTETGKYVSCNERVQNWKNYYNCD
jgi:predicted alpha/beta superfamily hydrolase